MTYKLILIIIFACLLGSKVYPQDRKGSVTIRVIDPFGRIVTPVVITKFKAEKGSGTDYASHFGPDVAEGIPFGVYQAVVRTDEGQVSSRVQVERNETLIIL